jgi:predicted transcriptional regulator
MLYGRGNFILTGISPGRRSFLEIIASILIACHYGNKKTHIMLQCNLNFGQLARYLDFLLDANLISIEVHHLSLLLRATRKGEIFLKSYDSIQAMME